MFQKEDPGRVAVTCGRKNEKVIFGAECENSRHVSNSHYAQARLAFWHPTWHEQNSTSVLLCSCPRADSRVLLLCRAYSVKSLSCQCSVPVHNFTTCSIGDSLAPNGGLNTKLGATVAYSTEKPMTIKSPSLK